MLVASSNLFTECELPTHLPHNMLDWIPTG